MIDMEPTQVLLEKYWLGNISAEECGVLMSLLKEKTSDHIEDYEHEINSFVDDGSRISAIRDAEELLQHIHLKIQSQEEGNKKKTPVIWLLFNKIKWVAAAVLVIFFSKYLRDNQTNTTGSITPVAVIEARSVIHSISNTTGKAKDIQLKDGSSVTLYPESILSFSDSFNIYNRAVTLHGKAFFKVAKDAHRPFSVQVNHIVTTALGTHFMIDGREENKNIRVRLLEGKVVIHHRDENSGMKPVYLLPGQVCTIEPYKMKAVITQWNNQKTVSLKLSKSIPVIARQEKPALDFEKTLLTDVFKTMEKVYNIKIEYAAAEEKKQASFTGNFSPTASPELLLTIICTTNDLSFEKKENVYFISNLK